MLLKRYLLPFLERRVARMLACSFVPDGTRLVGAVLPSDESLGYYLPPLLAEITQDGELGEYARFPLTRRGCAAGEFGTLKRIRMVLLCTGLSWWLLCYSRSESGILVAISIQDPVSRSVPIGAIYGPVSLLLYPSGVVMCRGPLGPMGRSPPRFGHPFEYIEHTSGESFPHVASA